MNIESQIRDYISANILFSDNGFPYGDDASFLQEGIIDSVGVLELVLFVEDTFKVVVEDQDVIPDNFDSVSNLAAYIARKTNISA